ncbi:MAG: FMN-binding protein [Oscillospiraceae bacterium]|nr:FMN-binding protein [Oscillospiraceae bacterium]
MKQKASILRLTITLLVITSVVAAALAGVNALTKDRIAAIRAEKSNDAVSQVLKGDAKKMELTGDTGIVTGAYESEYGYAVLVAPQGFAGPINMMVGVDRSGQITGLVIVSSSESPGYGAIAGEDSDAGRAFRDQFIGMSGELAVKQDGGAVDSITGATGSSRTIVSGINAALEFVKSLG